ncbi:MAG: thioredoxin [Patescibacteria group bacterium]|nr:thioredoxin [Patescibacteria group bacterium]
MTLTLTDENFEKEIQNADKPVLVDFWALYCSPCLVLSPILEKIAEEYRDKFILAKVNIDAAPLTAQKYGIDRIPTVILFKNGFTISGFLGVRPEPVIKEWLEKNQEIIDKVMEKVEEIIKNYQNYALKNNWRLNPDRKVVERVVMGLLANEKKYGYKYCPCRRVTDIQEEDKGKICPCQWHREEIERDGHCLCGLFVK